MQCGAARTRHPPPPPLSRYLASARRITRRKIFITSVSSTNGRTARDGPFACIVDRDAVNLIIFEPGEASGAGEVSLSGRRAAHLLRVLKVAPGHHVRVGILDGPCGIGIVQSVADGIVELRCTFETTAPLRPPVDLLLALPRPKVMQRLWAQIAALGVGRIILTNAERVERNYFDTHVLTPECYRPLLVEGLQQARDTRLPGVSVHRQFRVLVEDELDRVFPAGLRLVASPAATSPPGAIVRESPDPRALVAIGPEGGWNTFEMDLLEAHGFRSIGVGPRTLRSDTACIALLALVHDSMSSRPRG
jgi:16S rRNA (uracil1498-N3)-methyltransferase